VRELAHSRVQFWMRLPFERMLQPATEHHRDLPGQ